MTSPTRTDERTAAFVKKYQDMYGEVPNQFAADAYDCVYAYAQALEAAGATPDMSAADLCTKMIEQFTSMTFDGLTGGGMTWNSTTSGRTARNITRLRASRAPPGASAPPRHSPRRRGCRRP